MLQKVKLFNGNPSSLHAISETIHWAQSLDYYADKLAEGPKAQYYKLKGEGRRIAYWRSDKNGLPCNGGTEVTPAEAGILKVIKPATTGHPIQLCTKWALHATMKPPRWNGSRLWLVALIGEVVGDEDKFGALARVIIGECSEALTEEFK